MAIGVRGLQFNYGSRQVLRSLDVDVGTARLTAILGRNGSGKSTLLRIIAGLQEYREGSVQILGRELRDYAWHERAQTVGFLPQQHRAVFPFTVADVVLTGRAGYITFSPRPRDISSAMDAMRQVGIWDLQNRPYTDLSGGEQQMVLIARVLAQQPKIVLMDEPTSHLDLHNQAAILSLARKLVGGGLTVVCVLHDPNLAFSYADDFIFLRDGRVVLPEHGVEPWSAGFLRDVYGLNIDVIPFGGRAVVAPARVELKHGGGV